MRITIGMVKNQNPQNNGANTTVSSGHASGYFIANLHMTNVDTIHIITQIKISSSINIISLSISVEF
jgi:hypothetical protein